MKMKVLVFDDSEQHRRSAQALLSGAHDVTIVSTYEEAERALKGTWDNDKRSYVKCDFDVFLSDLMVPASSNAQSPGSDLVGQEMPLGSILCMFALKQGVKYIGLVTDTNHHAHPASAALDIFQEEVFVLGDQRMFTAHYNVTGYFDEKTYELVETNLYGDEEERAFLEKYPKVGTTKYDTLYRGLVIAKRWDEVLDTLIS